MCSSDLTQRKGLLSLSPTMVYCFWHSGESADSSDLQLTFTPASYKEGVQGQLATRRLLASDRKAHV